MATESEEIVYEASPPHDYEYVETYEEEEEEDVKQMTFECQEKQLRPIKQHFDFTDLYTDKAQPTEQTMRLATVQSQPVEQFSVASSPAQVQVRR